MAIENKIKRKLVQIEQYKNDLQQIQTQKEELENIINELDDMRNRVNEELFKLEDYFVEHYASAKSYVIEVIKGELIEIVVAHYKTTTFAIYNGLICTAKTHPEDEYNASVGETIAVQRLINKILFLQYGIEI